MRIFCGVSRYRHARSRGKREPVGGQGPQKLVTEFGGAIAAGDIDVAMVTGSEPGSTARYFADRDDKPDFTEHVDGQLEDRGHQLFSYIVGYTIKHGLTGAPVQYGLMENARRGRLGLSIEDYRQQMAELFARFSKVAAKNQFSSSPVERSVVGIATVSDENRMISDPYPRPLVARDQVKKGTAAVLMSAAAARRIGVPEEKWVYLHGHADMIEQGLMERIDLGRSPAAVAAAHEALRVAGLGVEDIAKFDLYSCFPFPVFIICEALGLAADDPRGLTLTGGLPYFGGPGNSYSLHGIAETVAEMRDKPGRFGFVGANGGIMSKYSAGIYSTEPAAWKADRGGELYEEIKQLPTVAVTAEADGSATIETYSVRHDWPDQDRHHRGTARLRQQSLPGHFGGPRSCRPVVPRRPPVWHPDRGALDRTRQSRKPGLATTARVLMGSCGYQHGISWPEPSPRSISAPSWRR